MVAAGAAGIVFGARVQDVVGNALGSGLGGLLPGGDRFRFYTITNSFPYIPRSKYRLQVTGLVDRPLDLTLDDIDLPNRRITIAGHSQRLGDLSHQALRTWLDHRRATWPHTPNRPRTPKATASRKVATG